MKKEARLQAERMYVKAGGKITNREIADAVQVNPLTVGRWKRDHNWEEKALGTEGAMIGGAGIVRKKAARDKALQLYLEMGGNITNKDLARRVDVSPATVSKWKEADGWMDQLTAPEVEDVAEEELAKEDPDLDIDELAYPDQIIKINLKIDALLQREYLTSTEVAEIAEAKSDLLEAVKIYLSIFREVDRLKLED